MKKGLLSVFVIFLILTGPLAKAEHQVLTVGVEPSSDPVQLAEDWIPFLRDLSARTGTELRFRTSKDVLEYNRAIANKEFDLLISTPYLMTIFAQKYDAFPIAKIHHKNDFNGLALVGRSADTPSFKNSEIIVGISNQRRSTKYASVLNQLSRHSVAHILQNFSSDSEVIESISEGLVDMGIVSLTDELQTSTFPEAGLLALWVDDKPMVSYLSAHPAIKQEELGTLQEVLRDSGQREQHWAIKHGITQIEMIHGAQNRKSNIVSLGDESFIDEIY